MGFQSSSEMKPLKRSRGFKPMDCEPSGRSGWDAFCSASPRLRVIGLIAALDLQVLVFSLDALHCQSEMVKNCYNNDPRKRR
jgi:hypothetical protein